MKSCDPAVQHEKRRILRALRERAVPGAMRLQYLPQSMVSNGGTRKVRDLYFGRIMIEGTTVEEAVSELWEDGAIVAHEEPDSGICRYYLPDDAPEGSTSWAQDREDVK